VLSNGKLLSLSFFCSPLILCITLSICLSLSLSLSLSISLTLYLSLYLSISLSLPPSLYLPPSLSPSHSLSISPCPQISFESECASTIAIAKENITRLANYRRVQLEEKLTADSGSVATFIGLVSARYPPWGVFFIRYLRYMLMCLSHTVPMRLDIAVHYCVRYTRYPLYNRPITVYSHNHTHRTHNPHYTPFKPFSISPICPQIRSKLEHQLSLARKMELVDSILEISMQEPDTSWLSAEYASILKNQETIR
jgi:hypothetical protein